MFSAKREDGKAEWRVLYELLADAEYGTVFPMESLCAALGVSMEEKHRVYSAMQRAVKELRKHSHRTAAAVRPGCGYRVLLPDEHEVQGQGYYRKSKRAMQRSVEVYRATPLDRLDDSKRQRTLDLMGSRSVILQVLQNHERRIAENAALTAKVAETATARLDDHERRLEDLQRAVQGAFGTPGAA